MEKKMGNVMVIIPAALAVIILVAIAYVFGLKNANFNNLKTGTVKPQAPATTPVPLNVPQTQGEIANWKTYTDSKNGYSINYPPLWHTENNCQGFGGHNYICFVSPDFKQSNAGAIMGGTTQGGIVIIDSSGLKGLALNRFCDSSSPEVSITECKKINLGGDSGMRRKLNLPSVQVGLIQNNQFVMEFDALYAEGSENQIVSEFDQILSTFKFIK